MRTLLCAIGTIGLGLSCLPTRAEEWKWKPAPSPLVTRYAEHVSPREVPLYEFYPRPMMVRNHDGKNLSGLWDFAVTEAAVAQPPATYQGRIMVPFPIESALSGVKRSVARNEKLWYRIAVEVPWGTDWLKGQNARLMLRFDGVSGIASVFVNGKTLGSHQGSDDGFGFDVTDLVTAKDKHTLQIVVAATPADTPPGVQAATGIFKPAWIEAVRTTHIESLKFVPDADKSAVRVTATGTATAQDAVEMVAYDRSFEVARASGKMGEELTLKIENLRPWTPDRPFTYEYRATIVHGKQIMDSVFGLFAVRKVSLGKGENGTAVVLLNNTPWFLTGVLDAGWWPDGGATAPYIEAIRRDIEKIKQLGFNTVRKPFRTDQSQWYFWADRLGVMVLQELPPGDAPQLLQQYPRIIAELFNHPSIVAWVLPKDMNADAAKQLTEAIRKADPTRLVLGGPEGESRRDRAGRYREGPPVEAGRHSFAPWRHPGPVARARLDCRRRLLAGESDGKLFGSRAEDGPLEDEGRAERIHLQTIRGRRRRSFRPDRRRSSGHKTGPGAGGDGQPPIVRRSASRDGRAVRGADTVDRRRHPDTT